MEVLTDFRLEYSKADDIKPCLSVIIVAAGSATRMGGSKQLIPILGIPVIGRTIMAFDRCLLVKDIIVVAREDEMCDIQKIVDRYEISKVTEIIIGGSTRFMSVQKGLERCGKSAGYIAVHDGARPLVTDRVISETTLLATARGAAAPAVKVKDTIKRADSEGRVLNTPQRENLFAVQTPQIFKADIIKNSYDKAVEQIGLNPDTVCPFTDDCSVVEWAKGEVFLSNGSYDNIKITTAGDVEAAETILKRRMTGC